MRNESLTNPIRASISLMGPGAGVGDSSIKMQQVSPGGLSNNDLDYFESIINKHMDDMSVPFLQRRPLTHKEDPVEEIHDFLNEIKDLEKSFKRVLEISCKLAT
jgi:hypothetical protein